MGLCKFIVLVVAVAAVARATFLTEEERVAHKSLAALMNAVEEGNLEMGTSQEGSRLVGFSFDNCASPKNETLVMSGLDVKPDPIKLPGTLTISGKTVSSKSVGSPIKVAMEVYKKIFGVWIKVPCVDNIGSCTYDDICKMMTKIKTCPPILVKQGFNCRCPIPKATISLKNIPVKVDVKVPSIADGAVKVRFELTSGSVYVTCAEMVMTLN